MDHLLIDTWLKRLCSTLESLLKRVHFLIQLVLRDLFKYVCKIRRFSNVYRLHRGGGTNAPRTDFAPP